jgi:cytochrome P450
MLLDRLLRYYNPTLHGLIGGVLSIFAKPRETPLADDLVLSATAKTDPAPFTLLSRMEEKGHDMEHLDMAAECLDHMAAGIDTTGGELSHTLIMNPLLTTASQDALCFLMWEISQPRSRSVQTRLQQEIQANKDLAPEKLTYLEAVVLEGLRCFPAIPMSLPRYVPTGGRTIDGYFIPEKTIVSSQAFSTHRINLDVFPDPNTFNPDRWLAPTGDKERKQLFFAFASGGRGCVGKQYVPTKYFRPLQQSFLM